MALREDLYTFRKENGVVGEVIFLLGIVYFCQIVLVAAAAIAQAIPLLDKLFSFGVLVPSRLYLFWTWFTYPFFYAISIRGVVQFVVDCYLIWSFGRLFHQLWGNDRLYRFILLSTPLIGVLSALICILLGIDTPISSASGVVVALVVAVTTLTPNYPIRLFGALNLPLFGFTLILILLNTSSFIGNWAMLIMISLSCGVGFLFTQQLQKGNDWTEKIWLKIEHWRKPKPSMRVAYKNEDFSSPKEEKPIEVSQEIVDKILDKISDTGYNSLSHTEREILEKFAGKKKSDN